MEALIVVLFLAGLGLFVLAVHFYLLLVSTLRQVRMTQHSVHQKIEQERLERQQRSVRGTY
jgi:hypothetical protein